MRNQLLVPLILILSASQIQATDPSVGLEFRPIVEIGDQASTTEGPKGEPALKVVGIEKGSTSTLVICNAPAITATDYVVGGQVKYEGVEGDGYLELLNDFGERGIYFTRSLGSFGKLGKLNGTSDWREFELPFHSQSGLELKRLTLNVVLPGKGIVTVTQPLSVAPITALGHWWTDQQAGLYGGVGGGILGCIGALIGILASISKSRKLAVKLCYFGAFFGCFSLVAGIVAVCLGQPYHVFYPLLLIGTICTFVLGCNFRNISKQFSADEFRKMEAIDVKS